MPHDDFELASVKNICNFLLEEPMFFLVLCGPESVAKWLHKMDTGMSEEQVRKKVAPCLKELRKRADVDFLEHRHLAEDDNLDPLDKLVQTWVRYSIDRRPKASRASASLPTPAPVQDDATMADALNEVDDEDDEVIMDPPIVPEDPPANYSNGFWKLLIEAKLILSASEFASVHSKLEDILRSAILKRKRLIAEDGDETDHEETIEQRKARKKARKEVKKAEEAAEDKTIRKAAKKAIRDQETF
ncbi:hypothetical protein AUEXF2481DRAFT_7807 [Aureobasidium subglaciale EXF-2481]|uniref:Uncharacterized protein n=1 Tax=Aureobasidium subglaciale (strain EXF-2481) TaxID=1043005 RepID=A0A074Y3W2_AURSE|nr:uncharacterized protein AUEXF2481DRAFT_7807 [Aureobasidium subglaciale EXF-2481]KAI5194910.1 hypothetical protein E4T38_09349 [Aureobasidium subglaciale]KAI5214008.1 hypothetical protein E4T40_09300 [Aureobasidium subglaciale]KAI5216402.1 hypothetical protein E4T41_09301 [Aureobasidium subglaciale]KAI5254218.1 hypothetical protein E4T46_09256 [Aureobasidium subglaciale]KEQ92410.1 hypothetical protein AUEXF2481DRAFT_7807 [Aureobasidium subglaciale EXF-2481]